MGHQELNPIHYLPVSLTVSKLMLRTFQSIAYFQKLDKTTKLAALMHHGKQLPSRLKIQKEQQATQSICALPIIFSQEQFSSHTAARQMYQVSTFQTGKYNRVRVRKGHIE